MFCHSRLQGKPVKTNYVKGIIVLYTVMHVEGITKQKIGDEEEQPEKNFQLDTGTTPLSYTIYAIAIHMSTFLLDVFNYYEFFSERWNNTNQVTRSN